IVLSGFTIIGPLHIMYTIITLFVAKKATDLILDGLDPRKAVNIISSQAPVIADTIINQMNISVTVFKGYGGYLKEDTDMTYVIINKYQLMRLKKEISSKIGRATLFVAKKATELMLDGLDTRKGINIITSQAPVIADTIINQMNISVTVFKGYVGYLKEDTDMTYVIINKYQLMQLKKVISSIDADAFVVIHDVRDVFGGSFAWDEGQRHDN